MKINIFYIYINGQKYNNGNAGRIADFIDDYAGTTTNPSLGYAVNEMYSDKRPAISGQEKFRGIRG